MKKIYGVVSVNDNTPDPTTGNVQIDIPNVPEVEGTMNKLAKFNSTGDGVEDSNITDNDENIIIGKPIQINSGSNGVSGIKLLRLNNPFSNSSTLGNLPSNSESIVQDSLGNSFTVTSGDGSPTGGSITKTTPAGDSSVFASNLNNPTKIKIDKNNNLFIITAGDGKITRYTSSAVATVMFTAAVGFQPEEIAIDEDGNIYTSTLEPDNNKIFKITPLVAQTEYVDLLEGAGGPLLFDSIGNLFILQTTIKAIKKITPSLTVTDFVPTGLIGNFPGLFRIDKDDNLYFKVGLLAQDVIKVTPDGTLTNLGGTVTIRDIGCDSKGNIFCSINSENYSMFRITPTGVIKFFSIEGVTPFGIFIDKNNSIFVVNRSSNDISKVVFPFAKLVTLDEEGNMILFDENITQEWIEKAIIDGIENLPAIDPRSIAVSDSLVELTSTDLLEYEPALRGFKVHAVMIETGPIIYEKADNFWVKIPVTIVE